jgi:hypothetical protein
MPGVRGRDRSRIAGFRFKQRESLRDREDRPFATLNSVSCGNPLAASWAITLAHRSSRGSSIDMILNVTEPTRSQSGPRRSPDAGYGHRKRPSSGPDEGSPCEYREPRGARHRIGRGSVGHRAPRRPQINRLGGRDATCSLSLARDGLLLYGHLRWSPAEELLGSERRRSDPRPGHSRRPVGSHDGLTGINHSSSRHDHLASCRHCRNPCRRSRRPNTRRRRSRTCRGGRS